MMNTTTKTVREIALEQPGAIRVFERYGIDYCCGGRKPLNEACGAKGVDVAGVIRELEEAANGGIPPTQNWTGQPLTALSQHIVSTHHAYCRRELPRLAALGDRVVDRHGSSHLELAEIRGKLAQLDEELTEHLAKEEMVLFPFIAKLEKAAAEGSGKPQGCFVRIEDPIAVMMREHDAAGTLLAEIRELSSQYTPPMGACPTYHAFFQGLREFEQDLHQHVHLENNILFPRVTELAGKI